MDGFLTAGGREGRPYPERIGSKRAESGIPRFARDDRLIAGGRESRPYPERIGSKRASPGSLASLGMTG